MTIWNRKITVSDEAVTSAVHLTLRQSLYRIYWVVGAGLSTLETAAQPFLALCGPPRYSEIRLNLGQGVQGVGIFVAPLLASRVFFAHTVNTDQGLKNVQWTYLGVACFVALLIILFFLAPFPEITDADQQALEGAITDSADDVQPLRKQYTLFLGVMSQFCYVGAQVAIAGYHINFAEEAGRSASDASDLLTVAQGLYAFNRFLASFLMMFKPFKPRYMLFVYLLGCIVFSISAMNTSGNTSIALCIIVFCFESCCFATIFSMSLRGLGRHTKRGGSYLVAAISGGMVFPPMMAAVIVRPTKRAYRNGHPYVLAWIFPIYVNLYKREIMDTHRNTEVNVTHTRASEKKIELERARENEPEVTNIENVEGKRA
ncbi:L-fucose-proton symporter, putative [Talaromyces stipitatus ATCC 10500]|uniref:L-fucose-proton symporter, putative n=1 Tax=Talaromyces stipitatus (strain ATCC 10500 / CBS 375.48 / QM 6759 / NRRL 1006) TaxID=441959 RepID=B8M4H8_TALSN|nr:L-fucose-proton symporter, putative [Talaromyces stipitatus ATCC 10500]EED19173.1 L-fucose-proton symporter, putative [Talaromyces stipitatus ATCC 10500]